MNSIHEICVHGLDALTCPHCRVAQSNRPTPIYKSAGCAADLEPTLDLAKTTEPMENLLLENPVSGVVPKSLALKPKHLTRRWNLTEPSINNHNTLFQARLLALRQKNDINSLDKQQEIHNHH